MAVALISFIFILLGVCFKRNRSLYIVLFLWLWIIMAFTTGIADEKGVYMSRYMSPELWKGESEILYTAIILLCNKLNFGFYAFKAFTTFIQLLLISLTIWKLSRYPNLVLCLYMVYPFPLNVSQMRNALATAVFIFSIRYLMEDISEIRIRKLRLTTNDLKYILCILIAALIHSASLIWLVLLVAKKFSLRKNIIIMLIINAAFLCVSPTAIIALISHFGAGARMAAYFSAAYQASSWRKYGGALLNVSFTAAMLITLCVFICHRKSKFENEKQVKFLLKSNIIILCIYGLIFKYTGEVYRLQESMTVMNYMLITNAFKPQSFMKNRISISTAKVFGGILIFVAGIFYIAIGMYLYPTILEPILNNNMLLKMLI